MQEKFTFFWDGSFSQWATSYFTVNGIHYNCCEQYMMANKAILFEGPEWFCANKDGDLELTTLGKIMFSNSPHEQKELGKKVKNFNEKKWAEVRKSIVYDGNLAKYSQNNSFKFLLFKTAGTTLVEASPRDRIWGIGLSKNDSRALNRELWLGLNLLGEVLTQVREDLMNGKTTN